MVKDDRNASLWPLNASLGPLNVSLGPLNVTESPLSRVKVTILAVVFCLAFTSNLFVLIALDKQLSRRPKSRMYYFMRHLSLADLLVAVFNAFPQLLWEVTHRFRGNDAVCKSVKFGQIMTLYLSSYMLVVMSVDRYLAVSCYKRSDATSSLPRKLVAAAWGISAVLAAPFPFVFKMAQDRNGEWQCTDSSLSDGEKKANVLGFIAAAFLLPLILLAYCYSTIAYRIREYSLASGDGRGRQGRLAYRREESPGSANFTTSARSTTTSKSTGTVRSGGARSSGSGSSLVVVPVPNRVPVMRARIKTIKMSLAVVICFLVCWIPFVTAMLIHVFFRPEDGALLFPSSLSKGRLGLPFEAGVW